MDSLLSNTKISTIINQKPRSQQDIKFKHQPANPILKDEHGKVSSFPKKDSYIVVNNKSISSINKTSKGSLEEKYSLVNQSTASKEFSNDEVRLSNHLVGNLSLVDELQSKKNTNLGSSNHNKSISLSSDIQQEQTYEQDSIQEDENNSDDQDDLNSSQGSLTHNIWQNGNDDLIVRGIDTENWFDKQGNPFNIFNLYKARSGQFKTHRENLTNQSVQKNIERLYNSYSKERLIGENAISIDAFNKQFMANQQMKASSSSPNKIKSPITFQEYLIINPFKDSNDYTKSGYNNVIFDRFRDYYAKYRATHSKKYNFSPERIRKPMPYSLNSIPSNLEELNQTQQQSQKFIRSQTKKLTVDIFNSPQSKPTKQQLGENEHQFKLNSSSNSNKRCQSSNDLDRNDEIDEQDKQSGNNQKINNFQILRAQQSQGYKSHNILPLQQAAALKNQTLINKISQEYTIHQIYKNPTQNQICDVQTDVPIPQNPTSTKASYFEGLPLSTLKSKLESMQKLVINQKNRQISDKSNNKEKQELQNKNQNYEEILAPLKEELKPLQFHQNQTQLAQNKKQPLNLYKKLSSLEDIGNELQFIRQNTVKESKISSSQSQPLIDDSNYRNQNNLTQLKNTQNQDKTSISPDRKSIRLFKNPNTELIQSKINELQKVSQQRNRNINTINKVPNQNNDDVDDQTKKRDIISSDQSPQRKFHRKLFTEDQLQTNGAYVSQNMSSPEIQNTKIKIANQSPTKQQESAKLKEGGLQENNLSQLHKRIFFEQRNKNIITTTPVSNQNQSQSQKINPQQINKKEFLQNSMVEHSKQGATNQENLKQFIRKVSQEDKFIQRNPPSPKPFAKTTSQEDFSKYYNNYIKKEAPKSQQKQIETTPNISNDVTPIANTSTQDQSPLFFLNKNKRQLSSSSQPLKLFQRMYNGIQKIDNSISKNDESLQDQSNTQKLQQTTTLTNANQTTQENIISKASLNQHLNKYYIPVKSDQSRGHKEQSKNVLSFSSFSNSFFSNTLRMKQVNMSPSSFLQRNQDSLDKTNSYLNNTQRLNCQSPSNNFNEPTDLQITQKTQSDEKSLINNNILNNGEQLSPLKKRAFKYEKLQNTSALKPFINSLFPNTKQQNVIQNNTSVTSATNSSLKDSNRNNQTYYFSGANPIQNLSILSNSTRQLSQIDVKQLIQDNKNHQNNNLLKKSGFQPIKTEQIQTSQKKGILQPHKVENNNELEEEILVSDKQRISHFNN